MKKLSIIFLIYFIAFISSCCGDTFTQTEVTILTVQSNMVSFTGNYITENLEEFNRENLGLTIAEDSTNKLIVNNFNINFENKLYACQDENLDEYQNYISNINIYTVFNFDDEYLANNNINDNLHITSFRGDSLPDSPLIEDLDITFLKYFKFNSIPTNDTLQFRITGQLSNENFEIYTPQIILEE